MYDGPVRDSDEPGSEFKLSSLTFSVYLPTILFSIGEGAVIPVIPLFAKHLGASVAAASLVVALRGIGQLVFDLPAGAFVARWGDKWAMVAGTGMVGAVAVGAVFSPSPVVLAALVFVMGGGWAFWQLARLDYVTEMSPLGQRGRAMSMVGGMNRIGNFIGPVIGGFLGQFLGLQAAFGAQAALGLLASATMFINVEGLDASSVVAAPVALGDFPAIVRENGRVFLTAGTSVIAIGLLRQARQVFLPLWGDHIGLDVAAIGIVFSIGSFIDAASFYPSGLIMDRFGRKWAAVPCLLTLSLGLLLLPLTREIYTFTLIAIVSGAGNGFGSGIVMTLGADLAPPAVRGQFLGIWRLLSDTGQAGGPLVISLLTGIGSLALASVASAFLGFGGAIVMLLFVTETLKRSPPIPVPRR